VSLGETGPPRQANGLICPAGPGSLRQMVVLSDPPALTPAESAAIREFVGGGFSFGISFIFKRPMTLRGQSDFLLVPVSGPGVNGPRCLSGDS